MIRLAERLAKPSGTSSFISQRIHLLSGRILSAALIVTCYESSRHAFEQQQLLKPGWFWFTWGWQVATLLYALFESYILNRGRIGIGLHAFGVMFCLATWQFQLSGVALPHDFVPWIWWEIGISALCAGVAFPPAIGWLIVFVLPTYWYFFRQQPYSGGPDPVRGFQDAIFCALFAAVVLSMVSLLKLFASRADAASVLAREAMVTQARADAVERARLDSDSEVHSKILATLESAYNASHNAEHPAIAESAAQALQGLREFASSYTEPQEEVSLRNFFAALARTAKQQFESLEVDLSGEGDSVIDLTVANALTDATMQALDNAYKHAGGKSVDRKLHLKAKSNSLKIVVEDDGSGFRPSNISKDRLGIRLTIRGRVQAVGGEVKIDSAPGQGCRVIIEWAKS